MAYPLISVVLFMIAGILTYLFVAGFIWGAGYQPSPKKEIIIAGKLLSIMPGDTVYDLGCGFGKVVFILAEKYPESKFVGVDIDPVKSEWGKIAASLKGLSNRVEIVRQNILQIDLSRASAVYIFLSQETRIMDQLKDKMFKEMKAGSKVVSYVHKFHDWKPEDQEGDLRLYVIPAKAMLSSGV